MKVISMFSGAGGMDLGFTLAGHEIVWANDFDKDAKQTYINNISKYHDHPFVLGDIVSYLNVDESNIDQLIPDGDILIGGFPCQGFSIANLNRSMDDERNHLYLQILKVLKIKKPKFFVLENVKGLENMENGKVLKMIINDLKNPSSELNYNVKYNVLNSLNFGVPQNRERVIIFGVRNDVDFEIPTLGEDESNLKTLYIDPIYYNFNNSSTYSEPLPAHVIVNNLYKMWTNKIHYNLTDFVDPSPVLRITTMRDAISDLPEMFDDSYIIKNHVGSLSKIYPIEDKRSKYVGNRPTDWNTHSPTIMGRGSGTGGPLIPPHPNHKRRLSVRETARIQSFPDDFVFYGSNSSAYRQIGNAVPVLMALNIATTIPIKLKQKTII